MHSEQLNISIVLYYSIIIKIYKSVSFNYYYMKAQSTRKSRIIIPELSTYNCN